MSKSNYKKIILDEKKIPKKWYNIQADLPTPLHPPLNPATNKPAGPEDLAAIFPMNLIEQEVSRERWIDIPEEVLEKYLIWRPSPLYRADALERYLKTPARIYYKNEGVSPACSHKPNTAVAQAYYNKVAGVKRLTTETGAGQWGSALSYACNLFGLECKVYMVRISYDQKPYRKMLMKVWGADCVASPSNDTNFGRSYLKQHPDTPGSLGIAISEAIEDCVTSKDTKYSLGSVLNHVLMHQTIIGLETQEQLKIAEDKADVVIGCVGGGSNFAGMALPFIKDKIYGDKVNVIGVEPTACPTLTRGPFAYDFGDTAATTPLLPMHTLGHDFVPAPIHAGGLRYHGVAPIISRVLLDKLMEARSVDQVTAYKAGVTFARTEGFVPAPETNHAIAIAIEEAIKAREEGKEKTIVMCWSGNGMLDLTGYEKYFSGKLEEYTMSDEEIQKSLASLKGYPKP
ncbi:MAG: TrpB-like pyridoxal phosphate-dependent enzyme [Eubacteriales bacterium]|nr:TrpB-like pyridoxal phosphate-dependent enzyme [Eubacteriales bacterium]